MTKNKTIFKTKTARVCVYLPSVHLPPPILYHLPHLFCVFCHAIFSTLAIRTSATPILKSESMQSIQQVGRRGHEGDDGWWAGRLGGVTKSVRWSRSTMEAGGSLTGLIILERLQNTCSSGLCVYRWWLVWRPTRRSTRWPWRLARWRKRWMRS